MDIIRDSPSVLSENVHSATTLRPGSTLVILMKKMRTTNKKFLRLFGFFWPFFPKDVFRIDSLRTVQDKVRERVKNMSPELE